MPCQFATLPPRTAVMSIRWINYVLKNPNLNISQATSQTAASEKSGSC